MILEVYKHLGESNGDIIKRIKQEYRCNKICFAGRLDPMAHGLVIVLTDEDVKNSDKYMYSGYKKYKFEFIVGFKTDSGDLLGLINNSNNTSNDIINIINCTLNYNKQYNQKYHLFSSFLVNKKPLWWYGINNLKVNLPEKQVNISDIDFLNTYKMTSNQIHDYIKNQLKYIPDNKYRKEKILKNYEDYFDNNNIEYDILEFDITVSSGFYIRQFVQDIGDKLNIHLTTKSIYRYGFDYD